MLLCSCGVYAVFVLGVSKLARSSALAARTQVARASPARALRCMPGPEYSTHPALQLATTPPTPALLAMAEVPPPEDKIAARLFQREKLVKEIFETEIVYVDSLEVLFDGTSAGCWVAGHGRVPAAALGWAGSLQSGAPLLPWPLLTFFQVHSDPSLILPPPFALLPHFSLAPPSLHQADPGPPARLPDGDPQRGPDRVPLLSQEPLLSFAKVPRGLAD